MVRIKAVDAQNILDVCKLTANQNRVGTTMEEYLRCNAISIAEAKYDPEMHPNAIYNNNALIGFFMYQREEDQADTVTICRFMIDYQFQQKGLEEKALAHILKGLKIQGVKKVILRIDAANAIAQQQSLSFGFQFTGKTSNDESCYELNL